MNKGELIAQLSKKSKMPKTQILNVVNHFFNTIESELSKGKRIQLAGFGTWGVRHRKARTGRNPQTGASLRIPARKVPYFSAGKGLKTSVR